MKMFEIKVPFLTTKSHQRYLTFNLVCQNTKSVAQDQKRCI